MRPKGWDAASLDRFTRYLNGPRGELRRLETRLRSAGWTDAEVEPLTLAITEIGQTQELLALVARNLRRRPLESEERCPTCGSRWRASMRQPGAPCPDPWHYGAAEDH